MFLFIVGLVFGLAFFVSGIVLLCGVVSYSRYLRETQANSFMEEVDENTWHDETVGR